jgi:hypothetical protein
VAVARLPHLEAGVAGPEVELLFVAGPIGDVALAVDAQQRAVGVHHRQAVVVGRPRLLEERHRDRHLELTGERLEPFDGRVALQGVRPGEELVSLLSAEVGPLEQLGREHHLGALGRRVADVPLDLRDVLLFLAAERKLHRRHREGAAGLLLRAHRAPFGCCWVMQ